MESIIPNTACQALTSCLLYINGATQNFVFFKFPVPISQYFYIKEPDKGSANISHSDREYH